MLRMLSLMVLGSCLAFATPAGAQLTMTAVAPEPQPSPVQVVAAPTEPAPPPPVIHHMDHGFVSAGTALFLVSWTINIPSSLLARLLGSPDPSVVQNYDGFSTIPLVGPLVQMGFADGIGWTVPILAVIEAAEIAGFIMMIVGAIGVDDVAEVGGLDLHVLPFASSSSAGLNVGGAF